MTQEDKHAFDRIFGAAHFHMPACVMVSAVNPGEPIILASILELRKAVRELEARVTEMEKQMAEIEKDA